jgi:hypothetical protein
MLFPIDVLAISKAWRGNRVRMPRGRLPLPEALFLMRIASAVCTFLALTTTSVSINAQIVGGEFQVVYEYESGIRVQNHGSAVANAGDVNADGIDDFIIGASGSSPSGISGAGSAFVYSGATGSLLHRFDGELPSYGLGSSVAGAGDFDSDGYDDLIVGVPFASPGGLYGAVHHAGSVNIYSGQTGAVLHRFDGALTYDSLGTAVTGAGDINGDGIDDVILGATWAAIGGIYRIGAVYVHSGDTGDLLYQIDGPGVYSRVGQTISKAGDVNSDGYADFFIGAAGAEVNGVDGVGYAQLYSGATGTLLMHFDGHVQGLRFGWSVTGVGDVDGDEVPDLLVGAPGREGSSPRLGEAFVYSGASGGLIHHLRGEDIVGHFGTSVAAAGDVDGDGLDDLVVGAPDDSSRGISKTGAAFIYSGSTGKLIQSFRGTKYLGMLGAAVAGVGDVNGDGLAEVLVGAPSPYYGTTQGEARVFGLDPYLHSSQRSISISSGGQLNFQLDFPAGARLQEYKILMSQTGPGPSIYGIAIPLTLDQLVMETYVGNYPVPQHTGMSGTLDANAIATASMTFPAGLPPTLLGRRIWIAAVTNRSGQLPEFSSIVIPVTFVL